MDKQTVLREMQELGYCLFDQFSPCNIGYTELGVVIRDKPTLKHFDPEEMTLKIFQPDGTTACTSVKLKPISDDPLTVYPGRVEVRDRKQKRASFFAFGGSLDVIDRENDMTIYLLASSAPILELGGDSLRIPNQLAAEVELMLAVLRAWHFQGDASFSRRLSQLEPLQLYRACIASILMRFQRSDALRQTFLPLYHTLCLEKMWLKAVGKWLEPSTTLRALLQSQVQVHP